MDVMRMGTTDTGSAGRRRSRGPLPSPLTRQTGFLLSMLGRACREATERALAPLGFKPHHYGVLVVLETAGPASQQAVGERLGIDKSTMTVFVDQLEGLGLVERRRNPENRRAYELTLTDAGRGALAGAEPLIAGVEEAAVARLDGAERAQLHALLLRLLPGPTGSTLSPGDQEPPQYSTDPEA